MTIKGLWPSLVYFRVRDLPRGTGSLCKADGPSVGWWPRLGAAGFLCLQEQGLCSGIFQPGVRGCKGSQDAVETGRARSL